MAVFENADKRVESLRREVIEKKIQIQSSGSSIFGNSEVTNEDGETVMSRQAASSVNSEQSKVQRQYKAYRNTVATALRPVVVRFAAQPIRIGYTASRSEINTQGSMQGIRSKMFSVDAERYVKEQAPSWIKASIGSGVTTLESHPLLDMIANPNEFMTQGGLLQVTAASMMLTGRVAWWFDSSGSVREETGTSTRIWYVPWHWLSPAGPAGDPFAMFKLAVPNSGTIEVDGKDIFYAMVPDPEDPSKAWSAVQAQAASIDTDDNILMAQHTSMKNVIRPNLIITAGRMPGLPNGSSSKGPRALLDQNARQALVNAIKEHYQGVVKFGEPLVLDALIENVQPLMAKPLELDLVNSSGVTQSRIMQGVGTSTVVAGNSDNANRAGSNTAHEIFYEVVLNPLITLFGQALNIAAKRRYGSGAGNRSLKVWMDEAKPRDSDQIHNRVQLCMPTMLVGELREYLRSGNLVLEEKTQEDAVFFRDFQSPDAPVKEKPAKLTGRLRGSGEKRLERLNGRISEVYGKISEVLEGNARLVKQVEGNHLDSLSKSKSQYDDAVRTKAHAVAVEGEGAALVRNQQNEQRQTIRELTTAISDIATRAIAVNIHQDPVQVTLEKQEINISMPEQKVPVVNVSVPKQRAPVVNVTVPEQTAPVVNVENQINVPSLTPAVVNVASPSVNVTVNPEIKTPDRKAIGAVLVRDKYGNLTGIEPKGDE